MATSTPSTLRPAAAAAAAGVRAAADRRDPGYRAFALPGSAQQLTHVVGSVDGR